MPRDASRPKPRRSSARSPSSGGSSSGSSSPRTSSPSAAGAGKGKPSGFKVRSKPGAKPRKPKTPRVPPQLFQLEVLPGLLPFLERELLRMRIRPQIVGRPDDETLRVLYDSKPEDLLRLRTAQNVFHVERFDVPRPKALLGQQHLDHLENTIHKVTQYAADGGKRFRGFRIGAAGADSPTFQRLVSELQSRLELPFSDSGELVLRVVPGPRSQHGEAGWEVLIRLTPRPLSARAWRVANMEGGLNATVAAAMVDLGGISERDRILNAMCGSGTLLIERLRLAPPLSLLGCDTSDYALEVSRQNIGAAGLTGKITLMPGDATDLKLPDHSFDLVYCDLPWGDDIGSREELEALYPRFLREMVRLCTSSARMVVLTHAVTLFEDTLERQFSWKVVEVHRVFHGGHHPRMYLLRR